MKILRIAFFVFFLLYITTVLWIGDDVPFKPIYWLIAKLAGALIILVGLIVIRYKSKEETKILSLLYVFFVISYFGYIFGYKPIAEYKRNTCQDKFGLAFNKARRVLGVPEIPNDWHIRRRSDGSVDWWKGEKDTIGHVWKSIDIDSACRIELEEDQYFFKPIKDVSRHLLISTYYANGKAVDSIIYYYDPGNSNDHKISRQQADSIFAVERIAKDY